MRIVSALLLTIACSYVKAQDARYPTRNPTRPPTEGTQYPTPKPTPYPTWKPTANPTKNPTQDPTRYPTWKPTENPTLRPSRNPTTNPTRNPTVKPTTNPTQGPTRKPTRPPTVNPTKFPTLFPTGSDFSVNTFTTSAGATTNVVAQSSESVFSFCTAGEVNRVQVIAKDRTSVSCITNEPGAILRISDGNTLGQLITLFTESSCGGRTDVPNFCGFTGVGEEIDLSFTFPTLNPTRNPTRTPTQKPSSRPSLWPTKAPTSFPTKKPTWYPTKNPTRSPTRSPTGYPTEDTTRYPTRKPTRHPTIYPTNQPTTDRRFNINKYIEDNQAFLVYKKQVLEVSLDPYEYGPSRHLEQTHFVTTVYWLGPPQIKRDSSGRIDTVVARALEYVHDPDSVNFILDGIGEFHPEGFATVWDNVLEYYDSVITNLDKKGNYLSICRFNEAGLPEAAIVQFEPRVSVGAVKATWEFQASGVPELEQLEHDLGRKPTPESFPDAFAEAVANSKRGSKRKSKKTKKTKKPVITV